MDGVKYCTIFCGPIGLFRICIVEVIMLVFTCFVVLVARCVLNISCFALMECFFNNVCQSLFWEDNQPWASHAEGFCCTAGRSTCDMETKICRMDVFFLFPAQLSVKCLRYTSAWHAVSGWWVYWLASLLQQNVHVLFFFHQVPQGVFCLLTPPGLHTWIFLWFPWQWKVEGVR